MQKRRCGWVKLSDETYVSYHDKEWGRALYDDKALFELFCLETQAAGLSWLTVLKKREEYRKVFFDFHLDKVVNLTCKDIDAIMQTNVIKNRPKLESIINNAKLFQNIIQEYGSIKNFFWSYVENAPITNKVENYKMAPTTSKISDTLTKELKKRGFKFVGVKLEYKRRDNALCKYQDNKRGCD